MKIDIIIAAICSSLCINYYGEGSNRPCTQEMEGDEASYE